MSLPAASKEFNELHLDSFEVRLDPTDSTAALVEAHYVARTSASPLTYDSVTSVPLDGDFATQYAADLAAFAAAGVSAGFTHVADPATYNA